MTSAEALVLTERVANVQSDVQLALTAVSDANRKLEVLPVIAATLEHFRTDLTAKSVDHERRIQNIEIDLPGLRELRKWVIGGILAGIGMMGAALLKLVIYDIPRLPAQPVATQQTTTQPKP